MDHQFYESEILTRRTPRERLEAYFELTSRYPEWPSGSSNAVRVQAVIITDLVALILPIARAEELDDV